MLGMDLRWWSEIGLILDLVAFALLSYDLIAALRNERQNLDDILRLEAQSFARRYGFFAPDKEELKRQDDEFKRAQDTKRTVALKSMRKRRTMAMVAIALASVGFGMQIIGGWPV